MRTRRTLIVWGTAGLVLAVMALAIWWGGATAPSTSAQAPNDPPGASTPTSEPTPAPPLITLPAIEPDAPDQVIVSTPWGTLGVRGNDPAGIGEQTSAEDDDDTTVQTPITADKISRTGGYNEVFWHVQGSIAPGTTFLLERQAESLSGPDGGWKTVAQGISRNSYFDLDVVPNHWYRYRVTPSQDSTTIFQPGEIRYFARPWVFLDARGHADGVQLVIRADPNVIPPNQVATVMRFDYEERYDTIFHPVLTHARFGGEYVIHVDDDDITSGTIYYYRLVLSHIIGDGVYDPVTFGVPDVAVMAGLIEPSRPSTPVAEEDANGIITLSWARPTDDNNRQALAYEIQSRRIKPPGVEVTWVPRGTTLRHSFTLHDGPPAFAYNNYRVMPLMMDGSRSAVGSPNLGHPPLERPACNLPNVYETTWITTIHMYPDVIGNPFAGTVTPRLFDVGGQDPYGFNCKSLNPADFYLQRAFYFAHGKDDSCLVPGRSCTYIDHRDSLGPLNNSMPRNSGVEAWPGVSELIIETLTGPEYEPDEWGFENWKVLAYSDPVLSPGVYGIGYRVCSLHSATRICSVWRDTGIHGVGFAPSDYADLETFSFTDNPVVIPAERVYPDAVNLFTDEEDEE